MGVVVAFEASQQGVERLVNKSWDAYTALRERADKEGTKSAHLEAGKALGNFYRLVSGMSK